MPADFLASSSARAVYASAGDLTGLAVHFAAWVNVHTTPASTRGMIVFVSDSAGTNYGLSMGIEATTNKVELLRSNNAGANSQLLSAAAIPLGEWVLVYGFLPANAITDMTDAVIRTIVRGSAGTSGTGGTPATGTERTHSGPIGIASRNYDAARVLDATIGMVRIWTGGPALDAAGVLALYTDGIDTYVDKLAGLKFRADLTGTLTAEVGGAPTSSQGTITLDDRTGIPESLDWVNRRRMLNRRYVPRLASLGTITALDNLAGMDGDMLPVATVLAPNIVDTIFTDAVGTAVRALYLGETWNVAGSAIGYRLGEVDPAATRAPLICNEHSTIVELQFQRGCQGGPTQTTHTLVGTNLTGFALQTMTLGRLAFSSTITNGTDRVPNTPCMIATVQSPDAVQNQWHQVNIQAPVVHASWNISADGGATPGTTRTIRFGAASGSTTSNTRQYLMEYLEFGDRLTPDEVNELALAYELEDIGLRYYRAGVPVSVWDMTSSGAGQWCDEGNVSLPALFTVQVMPSDTILHNGSVPGQSAVTAGGNNDQIDDAASFQEYILGTYYTDYSVSESIGGIQCLSNDINDSTAPESPTLVPRAQTLVDSFDGLVAKVIVLGINPRTYPGCSSQGVGETCRVAVNARLPDLTGIAAYIPPILDNGATGGDHTTAAYVSDQTHLANATYLAWAALVKDTYLAALESADGGGSSRLQRVHRV